MLHIFLSANGFAINVEDAMTPFVLDAVFQISDALMDLFVSCPGYRVKPKRL